MNTRKLALSVTVLVMLLVSATAVSAAGEIPGDCLGDENEGWVTVDGNTICFMGKDDLGPDQFGVEWTTWTYGVRREVVASGNALSHITFDLCVDDAGQVTPTNGDTYNTPAGYGDFVGRAGIEYDVEVTGSLDPTTLVGGIKFQDPVFPAPPDQQQAGEVHIFQFTQPTQSDPGLALRPIGFKNGNPVQPVTLWGPICDGTNAVEVTSFKAQSMSLFAKLMQWLGLRQSSVRLDIQNEDNDMYNEKYEAPQVIFEGELEVQAGSPTGEFADELFGEWD